MPRKKKNLYCKYSQEDVEQAVAEYSSKTLTLRQASEKYGVPRSTISYKRLGHRSLNATAGKPVLIPLDVEEETVTQAVNASTILGLSKHQMMIKAGQVCKKLKIHNPFKNGIPGNDWFRGLKHRHPTMTTRKPAKLSSSKARLDKATVDEYFVKLEDILKQNAITDPGHIWNMDEKGVSLEHKPTSVIARKGSRSIPGRVSNSRENITIVAAINADGGKIPPLVIVKGKTDRSMQAYGTDEGPDGAIYTFQSNAWMEDVLGEKWFADVFIKNIGPCRPQILIMDQHKSHEVIGLLEKARQEEILIFVMPSHSSHFLQPLDKGVFGLLKKKL
ncbi:jerky protein homolog-like [Pecten maximus]|uniref:jerky protein homolog-like n=1 Tax=Pecten maximus TaxID=6579 RepID=UPI0014590843|nr:jerky protein homolog-like [Pecten maximus]